MDTCRRERRVARHCLPCGARARDRQRKIEVRMKPLSKAASRRGGRLCYVVGLLPREGHRPGLTAEPNGAAGCG